MKKLTPWKKGPPPCVGWWNASTRRDEDARRWWNGKFWSRPVFPGDSDASMAHWKDMPSLLDGMEWRGLAEPPK